MEKSMRINRLLCIFALILSLILGTVIFAQFDRESEELLIPPVSFKIIPGKDPVKIGKESVLKIKFSVLPGYHINVIPPYKIRAKVKDPNIKITATPVMDKNEIKKAEKLVAKGESVYLDTTKEHAFTLTINGTGIKGTLDITWTVEIFYCSEKDGVCYRKEIKSSGKLAVCD
jgi:hypothetical protein